MLLNFPYILRIIENSAVLQPNIQWSQNFHLKFISLYPPNSCSISMEHDGIGNSLHYYKETIHRNKYRMCRQTQNKTIWHSHLTFPYLYFTSRHMLHNFWNSKKHNIYISKYVVNDYTLNNSDRRHYWCPPASKVKVLIVNERFNIDT